MKVRVVRSKKLWRRRAQFYVVVIAANGETLAHGELLFNFADALATAHQIAQGTDEVETP